MLLVKDTLYKIWNNIFVIYILLCALPSYLENTSILSVIPFEPLWVPNAIHLVSPSIVNTMLLTNINSKHLLFQFKHYISISVILDPNISYNLMNRICTVAKTPEKHRSISIQNVWTIYFATNWNRIYMFRVVLVKKCDTLLFVDVKWRISVAHLTD